MSLSKLRPPNWEQGALGDSHTSFRDCQADCVNSQEVTQKELSWDLQGLIFRIFSEV